MAPTAEDYWSYSVSEEGEIRLGGEIDYTVAANVRQQLLDRIKASQGPVVLNLSELTYLDSSGLAVIIEARRHAMDQNRSLTLKDVSPQVHKILKLTKVEKIFGLK